MEFKNLISSSEAISDLNRLLGLQTPVTEKPKDRKQVVSNQLLKTIKLSRKVYKEIRVLTGDLYLISDYLATVSKLESISRKIISELEGNQDVKKDIETP